MGLWGPLKLVEGIIRDIASNLIISFDAAVEACVVSSARCYVKALLRWLAPCPEGEFLLGEGSTSENENPLAFLSGSFAGLENNMIFRH